MNIYIYINLLNFFLSCFENKNNNYVVLFISKKARIKHILKNLMLTIIFSSYFKPNYFVHTETFKEI